MRRFLILVLIGVFCVAASVAGAQTTTPAVEMSAPTPPTPETPPAAPDASPAPVTEAAPDKDPLDKLIAETGVNPNDPDAKEVGEAPVVYTAVNPPAKPKALTDIEKAGGQLRYIGSFAGLYGWISIRNGQPEYYYSTKDGAGVVMGLMFDGPSGGLVTGQQLEALKTVHPDVFNEVVAMTRASSLAPGVASTPTSPVPGMVLPAAPAPAATPIPTPVPAAPVQATQQPTEPSPSQLLIQALQSAAGFTMGKAGAPLMYVFIDPECPHCKKFLEVVRDKKFLEDGKLAIRVMPVTRSATSTQKAAYLLAVSNPQDVLMKSLSDQSVYEAAPKGLSTAAIEQNVQLSLKFNFNVTPTFIYTNTAEQVKILRGLPSDLDAVFKDMGIQ